MLPGDAPGPLRSERIRLTSPRTPPPCCCGAPRPASAHTRHTPRTPAGASGRLPLRSGCRRPLRRPGRPQSRSRRKSEWLPSSGRRRRLFTRSGGNRCPDSGSRTRSSRQDTRQRTGARGLVSRDPDQRSRPDTSAVRPRDRSLRHRTGGRGRMPGRFSNLAIPGRARSIHPSFRRSRRASSGNRPVSRRTPGARMREPRRWRPGPRSGLRRGRAARLSSGTSPHTLSGPFRTFLAGSAGDTGRRRGGGILAPRRPHARCISRTGSGTRSCRRTSSRPCPGRAWRPRTRGRTSSSRSPCRGARMFSFVRTHFCTPLLPSHPRPRSALISPRPQGSGSRTGTHRRVVCRCYTKKRRTPPTRPGVEMYSCTPARTRRCLCSHICTRSRPQNRRFRDSAASGAPRRSARTRLWPPGTF